MNTEYVDEAPQAKRSRTSATAVGCVQREGSQMPYRVSASSAGLVHWAVSAPLCGLCR